MRYEPEGKCECGCGQITQIARRTIRHKDGKVVPPGEFRRYAKGHQRRRKYGLSQHAPVATRTPTTAEIYWAAGIYEGEGSAGINRSTQQVGVTQKDTWILYKLQELFGGKVTPTTPQNAHRCKHWTVYGARARGFLMTIYPLLSPRRQEQVLASLATRRKEWVIP